MNETAVRLSSYVLRRVAHAPTGAELKRVLSVGRCIFGPRPPRPRPREGGEFYLALPFACWSTAVRSAPCKVGTTSSIKCFMHDAACVFLSETNAYCCVNNLLLTVLISVVLVYGVPLTYNKPVAPDVVSTSSALELEYFFMFLTTQDHTWSLQVKLQHELVGDVV